MTNRFIIKPPKLRRGDLVAAVTLSWGGPGIFPYRYLKGKNNIEKTLGVKVIETKHALKSPQWIYKNPKARASDLLEAFLDKRIKGIFSTIGGEDSVRILKFIDLKVIKDNPKIFMGYSDTTVTHMVCYKAGLVSYYGPSIMAEFGENVRPFTYTVNSVKATLFGSKKSQKIRPAMKWTDQFLDWADKSNQNKRRRTYKSAGWKWIQGEEITEGPLLGGNLDTLELVKETQYFPGLSDWKGAIFYFETSENKPPINEVKKWLRGYGNLGILNVISGIIVGRPVGSRKGFSTQIEHCIKRIVIKEFGCTNIPIALDLDFGHTDPKFVIPNGLRARLNPIEKTFELIEPTVK